jgi:hypothetical protein
MSFDLGGMMREMFALGMLILTGCQSLAPWQQAGLQNIRRAGLPEWSPKSPAAAGVLNILPGIGDGYNGEWGAFICNFLFWPLSIVWGIPEAAVTASNINKQETWAYYHVGPGKVQLEAALQRIDASPTP